MSSKFIIITSINHPTQAVKDFSAIEGWQVVVVADLKTPKDWQLEGAKLLTVEEQKTLPFETAKLLPWNHYARKNLGYLYAISQGADFVYETDDDNLPYETWQQSFPVDATTEAETYGTAGKYMNIYAYFSEERVWPRGFPLAEVARPEANVKNTQPLQITRANAPILQGVADLEPDVDAIYRLTVGTQIKFAEKPPLFLNPGTYCPFNSQNTLWYPEAFPYLYLPGFVPSRVTDIWRGYIAQRFLHQKGQGVLFCRAGVYQERNFHNLMRDFEEELDLYTKTEGLVKDLDAYNDSYSGMMKYLSSKGFFTSEDVALFEAWLHDLGSMGVTVP
jgi:STELLO glycosyltransferases